MEARNRWLASRNHICVFVMVGCGNRSLAGRNDDVEVEELRIKGLFESKVLRGLVVLVEVLYNVLVGVGDNRSVGLFGSDEAENIVHVAKDKEG